MKDKLFRFLSPIICIALGITLFLLTDAALETIDYVISSVAIIIGIAMSLRYLFTSGYLNYKSNDLVIGLIIIALGIFGFAKHDLLEKVIPFALGFLVLINGLREVQVFVDFRKLGLEGQLGTGILALINMILGICMILHPDTVASGLMKALATGLIISGVIDGVAQVLIYIEEKKHPVPDPVIPGEAKEVDEEK